MVGGSVKLQVVGSESIWEATKYVSEFIMKEIVLMKNSWFVLGLFLITLMVKETSEYIIPV